MRRYLPLALALLASACITTNPKSTPELNRGPWVQPSPEFATEIEQHAAKLPYLNRMGDFVGEIQWFIGAGEAAYAVLLELAASDDSKVAGAAFAALGGSGDARLVPHIELIPWPEGEGTQRLRYARARCHMKLGDWTHVGVLVEGLRDEDLYARSLCFKSLHDVTGETFAYHPKAEIGVREASVKDWMAWSERVGGDTLQD